jgi:hypothetical protein
LEPLQKDGEQALFTSLDILSIHQGRKLPGNPKPGGLVTWLALSVNSFADLSQGSASLLLALFLVFGDWKRKQSGGRALILIVDVPRKPTVEHPKISSCPAQTRCGKESQPKGNRRNLSHGVKVFTPYG